MLFGVGTFSLLLAVLSTSSALPADKNCTRKLDADIGTTALVADVTASPTSVQSTQGVVLANVQAVSSSSVISASGTSAGAETVQTASQTNTTPSSSSASSLASTSSSSSSASSDSQTFLDLHNEFRALYDADAVTWNDTLASYASDAASACNFAHTGGPYGENLAAGVGAGYNITSGFNSWTNEASDYDSSNPQASHFTQVVWQSTTQIGCAVTNCADGTVFTGYGTDSVNIVCEYYPPGNVIGAFASNVAA
ncbi:hypothetical protein CNBD2890 [Cryptococcus deneoformans B-3501A]|uniref:SCP domain-containing protein n=1 Tax=Cryptococcus deneoformans (strain JEC21 / ATCC MYA-565) TaxID=214684 RepID=Q5KIC6_CRYD1|nr:conserved hypothetical protein [Cryptococcus neoformans var. neoformans JEC21]XP_775881.1 hypothetical protein CNBD2890 [Cryptococcus neoformans var. neoformans B-3501A]AAW43256.1 conserved hypothetical protein [Cryptococcus neoformans var. neoformans JEC21]EAL21234.1 hypothetical protein CNBD2890 [Cryptococcus neoformans var. neoformans B-3501A]